MPLTIRSTKRSTGRYGLAVRVQGRRSVRGGRHGRFLLADAGRGGKGRHRRGERDARPCARARRCRLWHAIAKDLAVAAERAGADGLLLLPPYLVNSEQEGLMAHVEAVCAATKLGVIVYNRDNAVLSEDSLARLAERCPNLVGYKDGIGDIELMVRIQSKIGDPLHLCGRPAHGLRPSRCLSGNGRHHLFLGGVQFRAEFSTAFYAAVRRRDRDAVAAGLKDFILPLLAIRNRKKGLSGLHHQGRHEGDRPRQRPGASAADRISPPPRSTNSPRLWLALPNGGLISRAAAE